MGRFLRPFTRRATSRFLFTRQTHLGKIWNFEQKWVELKGLEELRLVSPSATVVHGPRSGSENPLLLSLLFHPEWICAWGSLVGFGLKFAFQPRQFVLRMRGGCGLPWPNRRLERGSGKWLAHCFFAPCSVRQDWPQALAQKWGGQFLRNFFFLGGGEECSLFLYAVGVGGGLFLFVNLVRVH